MLLKLLRMTQQLRKNQLMLQVTGIVIDKIFQQLNVDTETASNNGWKEVIGTNV